MADIRPRAHEQPAFSWLQLGYSVAVLGFLFFWAWVSSDSILHALLAVVFFVGILLAVVFHNLGVQKQRFLEIGESDSMAVQSSKGEEDEPPPQMTDEIIWKV
ncbi:MAG: hypothetical protein WCL32_23485 [Planctomycetota bacterium]